MQNKFEFAVFTELPFTFLIISNSITTLLEIFLTISLFICLPLHSLNLCFTS